MKRTILSLADATAQADAILAASKERWPGDFRMERIENDEGVPGPGGSSGGGTEDPPDDSTDDDDADDTDDDDSSDDADDDKKDEDKDDKVDRAEYERVKRHRAAADRAKAELQTENTRLKTEIAALKAEGKDGKLDEATTQRVSELESNVTQRDETIQRLRIENAFLSSNTHDWADKDDALRLADLADVEIEDDGTVHGLKQALDKLAKAKPHLLKKSDSDDKRGPSGSANNGKRKGGSTKPDRAALSKSYPILGARR